VFGTMSEPLTASLTRPDSRPSQPLVCRLRRKGAAGHGGPAPVVGELELENQSPAIIDVEHTMTPLQFLDLIVTGPDGAVISTGHFADRFSPSLEPSVQRLSPGATYLWQVPLLGTVPAENRRPGTYHVRAVYEYNGMRAVSEPVEIRLP
jgi:hypothetical protein